MRGFVTFFVGIITIAGAQNTWSYCSREYRRAYKSCKFGGLICLFDIILLNVYCRYTYIIVEPCDQLPAFPVNSNDDITIFKTSVYSCELYKKYEYKWNNDNNNPTIVYNISFDNEQQTILGFGGAFTDAVTYNLQNISDEITINEIISSYFSWSNENNTGGLGYTVGRVPIASTDFSPYSWTYIQDNDFELTSFQLNQELELNKYGRIDLINQAKMIINETCEPPTTNMFKTCDLRLHSTPWSAPPWMKVNTSPRGLNIL